MVSSPCSVGGYIVLRIGVVGFQQDMQQKLELRLGLMINILSPGSLG